jgi:hypothetical protein
LLRRKWEETDSGGKSYDRKLRADNLFWNQNHYLIEHEDKIGWLRKRDFRWVRIGSDIPKKWWWGNQWKSWRWGSKSESEKIIVHGFIQLLFRPIHYLYLPKSNKHGCKRPYTDSVLVELCTRLELLFLSHYHSSQWRIKGWQSGGHQLLANLFLSKNFKKKNELHYLESALKTVLWPWPPLLPSHRYPLDSP